MVISAINWVFHRMGWTLKGELPELDKYVLIAAPHTSNWDFVIAVMAKYIVRQKINYLGKHQLFIPPWGWFFRATGGSPVNRSKNNNLVDTAIHEFKHRKSYKLALAPEGTRANVSRWKTGFYHIAKAADVPIICIGLDFKNKQIVIDKPMKVSDDMASDMNQILDFFRGIEGKYPKEIPQFEEAHRGK